MSKTLGNMGRPAKNTFKVSKLIWWDWNNAQRAAFNRVMRNMRPSRQLYFVVGAPLSRHEWVALSKAVAVMVANTVVGSK